MGIACLGRLVPASADGRSKERAWDVFMGTSHTWLDLTLYLSVFFHNRAAVSLHLSFFFLSGRRKCVLPTEALEQCLQFICQFLAQYSGASLTGRGLFVCLFYKFKR